MAVNTVSILPTPYGSFAQPNRQAVAPPMVMAWVPIPVPSVSPGLQTTGLVPINPNPMVSGQPIPLALPPAQPLMPLQILERTVSRSVGEKAPKALSEAAVGAVVGATGAFSVNGLMALEKLHLLRRSMGATSIHAFPHFFNIGGMSIFAGVGALVATLHKQIVNEAKTLERDVESGVKSVEHGLGLGHGFWGGSNAGALETAQEEGVQEGLKEAATEAAEEAAQEAAKESAVEQAAEAAAILPLG